MANPYPEGTEMHEKEKADLIKRGEILPAITEIPKEEVKEISPEQKMKDALLLEQQQTQARLKAAEDQEKEKTAWEEKIKKQKRLEHERKEKAKLEREGRLAQLF